MGQALTITRTDHCAADLRAAASKSDDAAQVRRLLAIALALDGDPRSEAAERSGMDRQTLRGLGASLQRRRDRRPEVS